MTLLRSICLIAGTLSAVHTAASVPRPGGSGFRRLSLNRRQNDDLPPQCDTTCDPINTLLASQACDTDPAQCCTTSFQSGYFSCLECVGFADNVTAAGFAVAQTTLDNLTILCSEDGFALPELTLPGQNPNRTLATASAGSSPSSSRPAFSQVTISALPSSTPATPTVSQKTVTAPPTQPASPSSSGTAIPTTTKTNAAHSVRFDRLPSLMVVGGMMLLLVG
ncbi:hypothetical protein B0H11DRAFT_2030314 [Mycena galericulata]|nr:hypothetical protein B0H11DRAFT_2030314 [Mycena galericulata]